MIDRIVHEIRMALSHELYLSALALALTLPDTCGKAEYPNEDYNGVRYKNWCSQYVITDRCDSPYGYDCLLYTSDAADDLIIVCVIVCFTKAHQM